MEWRDIETAPRGVWFTGVFYTEDGRPIIMTMAKCKCCEDFVGRDQKPLPPATHWMPLPEPPQCK